MSVRAAFFWGSLGAGVAAAVAALRAPAWSVAFAVLFGASALLMAPIAALLAAPRRAKPQESGHLALLAGLALASPVLAALLSTLKTSTHHRPLGAVTFAVFAAFVLGATSIFSQRVLRLTAGESTALTRWARRLFLGAVLAGPLLLLGRAAAIPGLRTGLFDLSLGLGSGVTFRLIPWPGPVARCAHAVGPVLWGVVVAVGLVVGSTLGSGPADEASVALAAPLLWLLR